jgi:hypothetical protein
LRKIGGSGQGRRGNEEAPHMDDVKFPLMTRRQACQHIQEKLGIPVSLSTWEKDAARGKAPRPTAKLGRKEFFTEEAVLEYGKSRLQFLGEQ